MRTYEEVKAWCRVVLDNAGFQKCKQYPGPDLPDEPNAVVVWTRYGGPGLDDTDIIDEISWQARVIGTQGNYNSAENIADAIDLAVLNIHSQRIGTRWISKAQRVGGAPAALLLDDADRTHFTCSYTFSTELALNY